MSLHKANNAMELDLIEINEVILWVVFTLTPTETKLMGENQCI